MKKKSLQIRNSTTEFLIFTTQTGADSVEVRVEDETVWLTQKLIASLFDVSVPTINEHLKNIFESGELDENSVIRNFRITASDGKEYDTKHYNLDAIISIGYRVNSRRATQFRIWATRILRNFIIKGYVLDKERLKNGSFFGKEYFEDLLLEIREIRASERNFYQKITDIYATAMDYNPDNPAAQEFFAVVQNKLHFAIHGHTAAELIVERVNNKKPHMGLTSWKHSPNGKIIQSDVFIAKNYLTKEELVSLDRIVSMYLDYAEERAVRKIPMTMTDWEKRLNAFLQFNERNILQNAGKVSNEIARSFVESEFEKYRIVQDKLFESDFDKAVKKYIPKGRTGEK